MIGIVVTMKTSSARIRHLVMHLYAQFLFVFLVKSMVFRSLILLVDPELPAGHFLQLELEYILR